MKAIVIDEPGPVEHLSYREVASPQPGPGEILIDVHATALNRADLLQRRGLYPPPPGASDILGLECAGVVASLGEGVAHVSKGDRVMALLSGGGYAEQAVIDHRMAIPIPKHLSFEQAAAIPEAFLTASEALFTLGRLQQDQRVLIHAAAGGVGSAAVQIARHHGATVFATAGTPEKRELALRLGAEQAIDYKNEDFAAIVKAAGRAHLVLDFVGAPYWEKHASCLSTAGRVVVIGVMGGAKATVNLGQLLMKRLQILGLVMRSRPLADKIEISERFRVDLLPAFECEHLVPVIDSVFDLADAAAAHTRMESNANLGKIVLRTRS